MFLSLGLSIYALGVAVASRYFFGQSLVFGQHPGLIYVICLSLSLCLCPLGRQASYARFYSAMASLFTSLTGILTGILWYYSKRENNRSPWLFLTMTVLLVIPLALAAIAAPILLFAYHMALARARRPFWVLALQATALITLLLLRGYAIFHPEYEAIAVQGIGYWLISYSLVLLTLANSYLRKPYQLPTA